MGERRFPIQGDTVETRSGRRHDVPPTTIPWSEAEIAYRTYADLGHGSQSLERLAERGGFGRWEFAMLHPPVTEHPEPGGES